MTAARKSDPASNPTRSWATEMTEAADRDHQLEKGEYVLGMLSARLYCQRNAVVIGRDLEVDLHEDWSYADRQSDVDEATYQARLAWFKTKYHDLTGDNAGVTDDGKVNCRTLSEMRHEIERQREDNLSSHPLLSDVRPIRRTGDQARDIAAELEGQTYEVKCATGDVPGYGPADPAGGFEAQRADHPTLNDCSRKKTLSDRLVAEPSEAKRVAILKEAATRKRQDALKRLKEICGPGNNDLAKEGKRASHVDGIVTDYLACRDVGAGSGTCDQRRSEGWVLCRSYAQKFDDDRLQELKDFYKQMGMMVVTTAAMMVPGGGVAMRLVNLGLIGGGFAMEYREKVKAEQQLQVSSVDFNNQKITYSQYKQALSSKEAVSDNFWAWQAVNLVFAGMEAKGIRDAIQEYRTGKAIASLSVFADEGAASRALERSEAMGANHWTGEETYRYLKNLEATQGAEYAGLADEYLGGARSALSSSYGAGVNVLHDSEDVLTLERFETRVRELEKTDPIAAHDLRAKAADYLNSGSCGI
jgi:hypothetical protein